MQWWLITFALIALAAVLLCILVALYAFWSLGRALHEDGTTRRVDPDMNDYD